MPSTRDKKFAKWLKERGCEVLPPTNQYESVRWKGKEVGVKYTSGKFSGSYASIAWQCFCSNSPWDGAPPSTKRKSSYKKQRQKIKERDGCNCFYCGQPLGDDETIEHVYPLAAGGPNILSNMVLAHTKCNQEAGAMSIVEKVKIAIENRLKDTHGGRVQKSD